MNILIVASKFPPEYSGPGVRMPRLYKEIGPQINLENLSVLCGGIEFTKNETYRHEDIFVQRTAASYIRNRNFPFNLLNGWMLETTATFFENIMGLLALSRLSRPDYIHILGTSGLTAAALFWAKWKNIPVFQELVTAKATPCQRFLLLGKACPPEKSVIVAMRNDVRDRCIKSGYKKQIWHRPNPFNEKMFFPLPPEERPALRSSLMPFADDDIVLCSVAKIIPQKNQIFLIDVLSELEDRYKLVIAGPKVDDGPLFERDKAYLESLYQKIKTYGLESRVHIWADYVQSHLYMKASDLYMLPAYDEGFGTPMMEAIACGVPVIANADESAFAEWIEEGENGYLRPLNPAYWAKACREAAAVPREKRLAEAKKIVNLAGQDHIYKQYIEKIHDLTLSREQHDITTPSNPAR